MDSNFCPDRLRSGIFPVAFTDGYEPMKGHKCSHFSARPGPSSRGQPARLRYGTVEKRVICHLSFILKLPLGRFLNFS